MKKVATAVLAGMFFVNFSASANEGIQKPDFLAHTTDAVFIGGVEMSEVRGEWLFVVARLLSSDAVKLAIGAIGSEVLHAYYQEAISQGLRAEDFINHLKHGHISWSPDDY